ncbi:MAG: hypothetical protein LBM98_11830 [Oscillospiraceae bacterium]|jgi:serpin B|nr:hypothetical protein [Oscillospiraceae bacterium]
MNRKIIAFLFLISIIFAGCATTTVQDEPIIAKDLIAPARGEDNSNIAAVAKGANDFAFRLSSALVKNAENANFICSPFSVWLPLAALSNAIDKKNKPELLDALGAAGQSVDDVNNAASRMLYDLTNADNRRTDNNPLKIANAVFVDKKETLKLPFAQTFADYFRGNFQKVDFSSRKAVDAVNKWASDNTDGLIQNIIENFNEDTVAAIANAIYFSDRWAWEFNPGDTKEDAFHSPEGDSRAFYMSRDSEKQVYYEDEKLQAISMNFKTNGGLYILLPKEESAVEILTSMTSGYFDEIINGGDYAEGKLLLPRFEIESGAVQLKDSLTALGIPLFDAENPVINGLIENDPLFISSAVQKSVINVDEKGTTAAAVTVIAMDVGAALAPEPEQVPFEMICDKPFVFILYGETYDGGRQVLFTGVVNQP